VTARDLWRESLRDTTLDVCAAATLYEAALLERLVQLRHVIVDLAGGHWSTPAVLCNAAEFHVGSN
jgi:hypothetical protein